MYYISIDSIVRSCLAQRTLPIHYYLKYLKLATDCLRELHYDVLGGAVHTRKLEVTDYKAVVLPEDFLDVVSLSVQMGDRLLPLTQAKLIKLNNFNDMGDKIPFESPRSTGVPRETSYDDYGEFTGKIYQGVKNDGDYIVIPERGDIQLRASSDISEVILEYLGDLNYTDAATKVDPYAQATIEAFVYWKADKQQAENPRCAAALNYFNQLRILRGRKNPLTPQDIVQAIRNGNRSTVKN